MADPEGKSEASSDQIPGPSVVLIEDEPQIRRFLRAALTGHGYRLFEAGSGEDGLIEAATRQPDLVILDLGLPDLDGLGVLARLDRKSTRLNSSHSQISYAVFCLKKKK